MFKFIVFLFKIVISFIKFILWCIFGGVKKNKKTNENLRSDYKEEFVTSSNEIALPDQAEDAVIMTPASNQNWSFGNLFKKYLKQTEGILEKQPVHVQMAETYTGEFISELRNKKTGYDEPLDSYIDDILKYVEGFELRINDYSYKGKEYCTERLNAIVHLYCLKHYIDPRVIFFSSDDERYKNIFDIDYINKLSDWRWRGEFKKFSELSKAQRKFSDWAISSDEARRVFRGDVNADFYFNCSVMSIKKNALCINQSSINISNGIPDNSMTFWCDVERLSFDSKTGVLTVNENESGIVSSTSGRLLLERACFYFKKINNMPQNKIISRLDISISDAREFREKYGEDLSKLFC
ncbi:TPA: hypothetical protein ACY3HI_001173 [Citrobacter braakii]